MITVREIDPSDEPVFDAWCDALRAGRSRTGRRRSCPATTRLIRVDVHHPAGTLSAEELASEHVHGHRWWTLPELQSQPGPALLSPRSLPHLLAHLLQTGPPTRPISLAM